MENIYFMNVIVTNGKLLTLLRKGPYIFGGGDWKNGQMFAVWAMTTLYGQRKLFFYIRLDREERDKCNA